MPRLSEGAPRGVQHPTVPPVQTSIIPMPAHDGRNGKCGFVQGDAPGRVERHMTANAVSE
jgi:hypothetical protein